MNTKFFTLVIILTLATSVSACGMKRALTLPKKEEAKATPTFYQELAQATPIDVLKGNAR